MRIPSDNTLRGRPPVQGGSQKPKVQSEPTLLQELPAWSRDIVSDFRPDREIAGMTKRPGSMTEVGGYAGGIYNAFEVLQRDEDPSWDEAMDDQNTVRKGPVTLHYEENDGNTEAIILNQDQPNSVSYVRLSEQGWGDLLTVARREDGETAVDAVSIDLTGQAEQGYIIAGSKP